MLTREIRNLAAAAKMLKVGFARPELPVKLTFAVTYHCQYRCKTCSIWQKRPKNELTTSEVLSFIEFNRGIPWVDVTGGEIFLRNDIEEILTAFAASKAAPAVLHFATNGYKSQTIIEIVDRLRRVSQSKLLITVSLDGYEELNDEIRGVRGGYRKQMETFTALRRMEGVSVFLGMTLSRENAGHFDATFESCKVACPDLRPEEFHLNVMQMSSHYYANTEAQENLPSRVAVREELARYIGRRGHLFSPEAMLEGIYLKKLINYLETGKMPLVCSSLRASCFLDAIGDVYPCITYSRVLGNLRDHSMQLRPLWNAPATRETQAEIARGQCPRCWTACEAYPSILTALLRPDQWGAPNLAQEDDQPWTSPVRSL